MRRRSCRAPKAQRDLGAPDTVGETSSRITNHQQLARWRQRRSRTREHSMQLDPGKLQIRDQLEEYRVPGYTRSAGTHVPPDVNRRLGDLH
jgi:hypothetical protein